MKWALRLASGPSASSSCWTRRMARPKSRVAADFAGPGLGRHARIGERPAGREDAGPVAERLDAQAAVVGERGQAGKIGGGAGLQIGIVDEGGADLVRLGQVQLGGGDRLDAIGAEQVADLAHLAFIVAGDDQLAGTEAGALTGRSPCPAPAKISAQPIRARRSRRSSPSSSKHSPSAVIWVSISLPSSVRTKLPSQPAALSSA